MSRPVVNQQSPATQIDTSLHARRRERRMRDPEFRAAYERAAKRLARANPVARRLGWTP